ncbi:MAG: AAA family ATPase, partial [Bacteroidota bacterium]
MRITKLHLTLFKNFKDRTFEFPDPNFTVVIGNNGLGKSSVLKAAQVALGGLLQSIPTLPAKPVFRRLFKPDEQFMEWSENTKSWQNEPADTATDAYVEIPKTDLAEYYVSAWRFLQKKPDVETLFWKRRFKTSGRTVDRVFETSDIGRYSLALYHQYKTGKGLMPIIVSFNAYRVYAEAPKVTKAWLRMPRLEKGYYNALSDTVNFESVYNWLHDYDAAIARDDEFAGTRESFYVALKRAMSPYLKDITYNSRFQEFEITLDFGTPENPKPEKPKLLSICSDGVRGFIGMVAEIAYRCVVLNGNRGLNAVTDSNGVVLIDEIDMLLHPNWQRHVVSDLIAAFPNIQFIATTHSPIIVQSLEEDQVINLDPEGDKLNYQNYGYEDIAKYVMLMDDPARSEKFNRKAEVAKKYFQLLAEGRNRKDADMVA